MSACSVCGIEKCEGTHLVPNTRAIPRRLFDEIRRASDEALIFGRSKVLVDDALLKQLKVAVDDEGTVHVLPSDFEVIGIDRAADAEPKGRTYEATSISTTLGGERFEGVKGVNFWDYARAVREREIVNRYECEWRIPLTFIPPARPIFAVHHALSRTEERIAAAESKRERKRALRLERRGAP